MNVGSVVLSNPSSPRLGRLVRVPGNVTWGTPVSCHHVSRFPARAWSTRCCSHLAICHGAALNRSQHPCRRLWNEARAHPPEAKPQHVSVGKAEQPHFVGAFGEGSGVVVELIQPDGFQLAVS